MTAWGGAINGSVDVILAAVNPGASNHYMLDGSSPGLGSMLYNGTVHLTQSGWIRAIGTKLGFVSTPVLEKFYNIQGPAPTITPNGGAFTTCPGGSLSPAAGGTAYLCPWRGAPSPAVTGSDHAVCF